MKLKEKYVLDPDFNTVWDVECLNLINEFLVILDERGDE